MNVALWIVQVIVGLMFLMAGGTKVMQPKAKLAANFEIPDQLSLGRRLRLG